MWNAWRAGLVQELFRKARAALSGQGTDHAARDPFAASWTRALGRTGPGGSSARCPTATSTRRLRKTRSAHAGSSRGHGAFHSRRSSGGRSRATPRCTSPPRTPPGCSPPGAACSLRMGWTSSPRASSPPPTGSRSTCSRCGGARADPWSAPDGAVPGPTWWPRRAGASTCRRCRPAEGREAAPPRAAPGRHPGERRQPRLPALHRGGRPRRGPPRALPRPRRGARGRGAAESPLPRSPRRPTGQSTPSTSPGGGASSRTPVTSTPCERSWPRLSPLRRSKGSQTSKGYVRWDPAVSFLVTE